MFLLLMTTPPSCTTTSSSTRPISLRYGYLRTCADPQAERYPSWHVPLYFFGWSFGVINPVIYLAFNQTYREEHLASLAAARDTCCSSCSCSISWKRVNCCCDGAGSDGDVTSL